MTEASVSPEQPDSTATEARAERRQLPRWRRIFVGVLVVLVCVLAPVSVMAVWLRNTVLHTDQYVDTMAPLAEDPAVQQAIANRVTNTLVGETNLEKKIADLLPDRAAPAAPFIAGGAEQVVRNTTLKIVESDQFATLWREMNRRAHKQVVAVLQGKGTDNVQTENGQVVVRIGPVVDKVLGALEKAGITLFENVQVDRVNREIVLVDSEDLRTAQSAVDLLNTLAWVLPFVLVGIFAIAVWLSGNRRRTVLRTALGIALAMGIVLTLFNLLRSVYLDALPASVNEDAATAVYDQVLSFLRTALRTSFVLAVVVAIGAWLSGPGRAATRIRDAVRRQPAAGGEVSPVGAFVGRYRTALRILVGAVAVIILVALSHPTPLAVLVVAVLVVIGLVVIELLGRNAPPVGAATPS
jgi:hypothetical protein